MQKQQNSRDSDGRRPYEPPVLQKRDALARIAAAVNASGIPVDG